jgi:hypothetical protein
MFTGPESKVASTFLFFGADLCALYTARVNVPNVT